MLIQICGLPGTGKSTLAAGLADRRPVVLLRIDAIEAAMWRNGLTPDQTGITAYSVAHSVALPHLERGQTVVADAVSAVGAARQGWRGTAEYTGVPLRVIETVCPIPPSTTGASPPAPATFPASRSPPGSRCRP